MGGGVVLRTRRRGQQGRRHPGRWAPRRCGVTRWSRRSPRSAVNGCRGQAVRRQASSSARHSSTPPRRSARGAADHRARGRGDPCFVAGPRRPRDVVEPAATGNSVLVASMCGKVRRAIALGRRAGADIVVAQGTEAGGHTGPIATFGLVRRSSTPSATRSRGRRRRHRRQPRPRRRSSPRRRRRSGSAPASSPRPRPAWSTATGTGSCELPEDRHRDRLPRRTPARPAGSWRTGTRRVRARRRRARAASRCRS